MGEKFKYIICVLILYGSLDGKVSADEESSCAGSSDSGCDLVSAKVSFLENKFLEQQQQLSTMELNLNSVMSQMALVLKRLEMSDKGVMKQNTVNQCNQDRLVKTIESVLLPKLNQLADQLSQHTTENKSYERTKDAAEQNEPADSVPKPPVKLHEDGSPIFRSCSEESTQKSGQYWLQPNDDADPFKGFCEQESFGGGWLVIQHRFDGSEDFYRHWHDYKVGFGKLDDEFWLGLETVHRLTKDKPHFLVVELETLDGTYGYAMYDKFQIGSRYENYSLKHLGEFNGTAGDALAYHLGMSFTTSDRDNDLYENRSCAVEKQGAWWYRRCTSSNLNGKYRQMDTTSNHWYTFRNSYEGMKKSKMMIKKNFD